MNNIYHNGKVIGKTEEHDGKRYFVKRVNSDKHKMKIYDGYGIQESIFQALGVDRILIIEEDTGRKYVSLYKDWVDENLVSEFKDGEQRFLPVNKMLVWDNSQPDLVDK